MRTPVSSSSLVTFGSAIAALGIAAVVAYVAFAIKRETRRRAAWSQWARDRGFESARLDADALGRRVRVVRGECAGLPFTLGLVTDRDSDGSAPVYVRLMVAHPEFSDEFSVLPRNLLGRANAALMGGAIAIDDEAFGERFVVASKCAARVRKLLPSEARDALRAFDGHDVRLTCGAGELALWWRGDELDTARLDRALRTLGIVLRGRVNSRAA